MGIPDQLTAETVADINASNQTAVGASYVPPAMSTPHKLTAAPQPSTISLPSPVPRRRNLIYTTQKPEPLPLSESSQEFTPLPARRRNTQPGQAVAKYVPRSQVPSAVHSGQISKRHGRFANLQPDAGKRETSGDAVVQSASRNEYTYTDDSDSSLTRYQEFENYPGFKESALTPKHAFALKRSPASSQFCSGGTRSNHVGPVHLESPEESDIADFHRNIGRLPPVRRERENGDPRNHRKSSLKGSRVNADGGIKSPDITDDLTGQHVEVSCIYFQTFAVIFLLVLVHGISKLSFFQYSF